MSDIRVDDFLREDADDAQAIRDALAAGIASGEWRIRLLFAPRRYELHSFVHIETRSIAHDDGCGDIHEKDVHISLDLQHEHCIELLGEADEKGDPATLLVGCHNDPIQGHIPSILWAINCDGIKGCGIAVKNMTFTLEPETAFAGRIVSISGDDIDVEVLSRRDPPEETGAYCMNRFDLEKKRLVGESLTIGFGYDHRFHRIGTRLLRLTDGSLAARLNVGDGLSWHQSGLTDFMLFFGNCEKVHLDNLRVMNTNAFAILTEHCTGIEAKRVILAPAEGQLFTGPRDGWKIYRCGSDISLEDCHFEGFRMDAQNIQSNFFVYEKQLNDHTLVFTCRYAPVPLDDYGPLYIHRPEGIETVYYTRIRILKGKMEENIQSQDASAARVVEGAMNHITRYALEFEDTPPVIIPGTLAEPGYWKPRSYLCRRSVFRNIAGAGHLIRCGNVGLFNNLYEDLMCAGIMVGAELDTHQESGHGQLIQIEGNTFRRIGVKPRYNRYGCAAIAVKSQGFSGPFNKEMTIVSNTFEDCRVAIELNDAEDIYIENNRYHNVETHLKVDPLTVRDVQNREK